MRPEQRPKTLYPYGFRGASPDFEKQFRSLHLGFVIWRYREGSSPDASGTTEARLAQSLWLGSQVFGD